MILGLLMVVDFLCGVRSLPYHHKVQGGQTAKYYSDGQSLYNRFADLFKLVDHFVLRLLNC